MLPFYIAGVVEDPDASPTQYSATEAREARGMLSPHVNILVLHYILTSGTFKCHTFNFSVASGVVLIEEIITGGILS